MIEKELISIIIPHRIDRDYKTLLNTIESIYKQTYKKIEVIIINDIEMDGKVGKIRNKGLQRANGEFLFFCDDDITFLDINALQKMINVLNENIDISIVYCNYKRTGLYNDIYLSKKFNLDILKKQNYISMMSLIRAKDFFWFDPELKRLIDWDAWLNIAFVNNKKGLLINEILFSANYDTKSITEKNQESYNEAYSIIQKKYFGNGGKNV